MQAAYWSGCARLSLVVMVTCFSCRSTGRQPIGQAVLGSDWLFLITCFSCGSTGRQSFGQAVLGPDWLF